MTTNETPFDSVKKTIDQILEKQPSKEEALLQICSELKSGVDHYDWVGFYELDPSTNTLVLGPYVGKPTEHTHIVVGKGVCGQVAESCETKVVQDVSQEGNYISCSIDVQSEIVVPVQKNGTFVAEIDIDSHATAPFTKEDEQFLSWVCEQVSRYY